MSQEKSSLLAVTVLPEVLCGGATGSVTVLTRYGQVGNSPAVLCVMVLNAHCMIAAVPAVLCAYAIGLFALLKSAYCTGNVWRREPTVQQAGSTCVWM